MRLLCHLSQITDRYENPGPIQFFGPDELTGSLRYSCQTSQTIALYYCNPLSSHT